ncbi:MAG TPA: phosphatase PAP2 family protein [Burkholderiales bacterium]|nr:phosphatase PAP2 family protein [Burkholderiales bacterium]
MRPAERLHFERFLEWDRACTLHLNRAAMSREWITVLAVVSRLSNGSIWYFVMGALALAGPVGLKCALHMFLAGATAVILYKLVKQYACRPRPCVHLHDVQSCIPPLDEFSFPSGHTLHAVTFTTVAVAYFPSLAIGLVPFTCCVGVSRVALGLHYPSDVLAGAAIGGIVGLLSFYFV